MFSAQTSVPMTCSLLMEVLRSNLSPKEKRKAIKQNITLFNQFLNRGTQNGTLFTQICVLGFADIVSQYIPLVEVNQLYLVEIIEKKKNDIVSLRWFESLLYIAVKSGNEETVKTLIEIGFKGYEDPSLVLGRVSSYEKIIRAKTFREAFSSKVLMSSMKSPLHLACEMENLPIVELLLEAGADLFWLYDGVLPLRCAAAGSQVFAKVFDAMLAKVNGVFSTLLNKIYETIPVKNESLAAFMTDCMEYFRAHKTSDPVEVAINTWDESEALLQTTSLPQAIDPEGQALGAPVDINEGLLLLSNVAGQSQATTLPRNQPYESFTPLPSITPIIVGIPPVPQPIYKQPPPIVCQVTLTLVGICLDGRMLCHSQPSNFMWQVDPRNIEPLGVNGEHALCRVRLPNGEILHGIFPAIALQKNAPPPIFSQNYPGL